MKSPQQAIFDEVYKASLNLGYDTYHYLPPKEAQLPFVHIGEQFDQDVMTKIGVYGYVQQNINIYGHLNDRRAVSDMVNSLRHNLANLKKAEGFNINVTSIDAQMLIEDVASDKLQRGIIEIEYRFN